MFYHDKTVKEVLDITATHDDGLPQKEAQRRLQEYGLNVIKKEKTISPLRIFLRQFNDILIYILVFAGIVSIILGERVDAYVIFAILIFNAGFGFMQEHKAEKAIELLRKLTTLNAKVIRDGRVQIIPSTQIVKGDVVVFEAGDKVPADLRIIEENNLSTDESSLTGESTSVRKTIKVISSTAPLADRANMLFSGTSIVRGTAKGVVTATGMMTEIGSIAKMVQEAEYHKTPLQLKLKEFGKFLGYITVLICAAVFAVGVIRGLDIFDMFLTAIALAVAAVPEGLPAVVTICLAIGVQRMVKRNALIRRLSSIETLGSITVICSDKTGTITKNEMTVTRVYANDKFYDVTGKGYNNIGEYLADGKEKVDSQKEFPRMLEVAATCNNSTETTGDPTERALLFAARKGGAKRLERKGEIPFDSDTKFMATLHEDFDYYKGAPEVILEMCNGIMLKNRKRRILPKDKEKILQANTKMAKNALRVLAIAYKSGNDMYFLGLMGMIDPPKEEVSESLRLCETAGIRPVMITGDHPITAAAVARKIGMETKAISGSELDEIGDLELKDAVNRYSIYARVTSAQKVRILKAFQDNGEIVAMTGDGINDAPALKNADVGIAMSIKGTDIARDASDMVLTDDHFSSIVNSVEEGRIVYSNIRKFINYLLSANLAEIGVVVVAMFIGLPLPLLPLQILWINLMTDSWPALALGVDPPGKNVMKRQPRSQKDSIMHGLKTFMVLTGIIGTVITLGIFYWALNSGMPMEKTRTFALTTLILFEMLRVYSVKSKRPFGNMLNNRWLNLAVMLSITLQILIIYTPLNTLFRLAPLTLVEWLPMIGLAIVGFLILEFSKVIRARFVKVPEID